MSERRQWSETEGLLAMSRGELRIYLGAAPGVGKTYAMLEEGHGRHDRGADVVVGIVETHGRARTAAMVGDLKVVPRHVIDYRGTQFREMDLDAVLARNPQVVLVDELAHTNIPGSRNAKRWQDIEEMLDAGITVLSTLNIQHLESLNDVVQQITGTVQRETVPDAWVRGADQIELVDMTPEALRRRMAHGNVYQPEKINTALSNYFRIGNLTALREIALLWLAGKVDDQLDRYRAEHGVATTWEARERVVVALPGGPEGETLIRRAARIASRSAGADLMAVHVARHDGLVGADPTILAKQRLLVEDLGGTYHHVLGDDLPAALIDFARGVNATQLVLGSSRRGRFHQLFAPSGNIRIIALSGAIDVHLVTHENATDGRRPRVISALSAHRRLAGFILALLGVPLVTLGLGLPDTEESLPTVILLVFAVVTAVALLGGMWPALVAAVGGAGLVNYFYTDPVGTFAINSSTNVLALLVFVVVAVSLSLVVAQAARRTREASQATAEAQTLATVAGSVLRGSRPLVALLERLQETFNLSSVALMERRDDATRGTDRRHWVAAASVGDMATRHETDEDIEVPIGDSLKLSLRGRALAASDRRIIEAFAQQSALALNQERLADEAASAKPLADADRMRTALLAAVSHDLRTPLAAAMAAVASLRSREVKFNARDKAELLSTAADSLDRLARLVANLLDMSRIQAGALGVTIAPTDLRVAVSASLVELGAEASGIEAHYPGDLPAVLVDGGLLERALVNVVSNALRFSPEGAPPTIEVDAVDKHVELRVVDHGPGLPEAERNLMFVPFQRMGDKDNTTGVGLGLALSRGLVEAMGGTVSPETTPGGGLTMCISLRSAESASTLAPAEA
jgi:two-component system sensor histidine kinase KdpD